MKRAKSTPKAKSAPISRGPIYLFLFIYFIILPHTMNYKQNKNDNK